MSGTAKIDAINIREALAEIPEYHRPGIGLFIDTSIAISYDDSALSSDNETDNNNIGIGTSAGENITTGSDNIGIGRSAITGNSTSKLTGTYNTGIGYYTGLALTSGTNNSLIGTQAGQSITTSSYNIGLGYNALLGDTGSGLTGSYNIGIGYQSGYDLNTGQYNLVIGYQAGFNLTTGDNSNFIGRGAGSNITTGDDNIAIGTFAGNAITTNSSCIAIGALSLSTSTNTSAANGNTAVGYNTGSAITTGDANTILGYSAGTTLTTGTQNTLLGYNAQVSAVGVNYEITLGDASITTLRCQQTSITALSDKRDKTNIRDISTGLDFINDLRPVNFQWDKRENYEDGIRDGSKTENEIQNGFIAQEVQETINKHAPNDLSDLILKTNPDKLELKQGDLLPSAIKAIQELSDQVNQLKTELQEFKNAS